MGAIRSCALKGEKKWKTVKNMNIFKRIAHCWERFAQIMSESLRSFFFTVWQERFAHSLTSLTCSFLKSNRSFLLSSLFIKERLWAIRSSRRSLQKTFLKNIWKRTEKDQLNKKRTKSATKMVYFIQVTSSTPPESYLIGPFHSRDLIGLTRVPSDWSISFTWPHRSNQSAIWLVFFLHETSSV